MSMFRVSTASAAHQSASARLRGAWLWIHRWLGLTVGVVLMVIGLTGSLLSFQREIDAALNPALFTSHGTDAGLSFARVQQIAQDAGQAVGTIRPPDAIWPVWVVQPPRPQRGAAPAATPLTTYIDPATGEVLGRRDAGTGFMHTVLQIHEQLLLQHELGRTVLGVIGALLLVSSLSGIWVWWPRGSARLLKQFVTLRRRPTLRFNIDLHRLAGIWIAVVLVVNTFAGICICFPNAARALVGLPAQTGFGGAPRGERAPRHAEPMTVDADAAVATARARLPGWDVTGVTLPSGPRAVWTIALRPADADAALRVRGMVTVDPWSGAVLSENSPRTRSAAEDFVAMQRWLHGGSLLGFWARLLVCAAGLSLPLFFVTGLLIWLGKRRNRRRVLANSLAIASGAAAE